MLSQLGAEIIPVDLSILKYSIAVYYILANAEASTNLARFDGVRYGLRSEKAKTLKEVYNFSKEEGYGPEVKRRILMEPTSFPPDIKRPTTKKRKKCER